MPRLFSCVIPTHPVVENELKEKAKKEFKTLLNDPGQVTQLQNGMIDVYRRFLDRLSEFANVKSEDREQMGKKLDEFYQSLKDDLPSKGKSDNIAVLFQILKDRSLSQSIKESWDDISMVFLNGRGVGTGNNVDGEQVSKMQEHLKKLEREIEDASSSHQRKM